MCIRFELGHCIVYFGSKTAKYIGRSKLQAMPTSRERLRIPMDVVTNGFGVAGQLYFCIPIARYLWR